MHIRGKTTAATAAPRPLLLTLAARAAASAFAASSIAFAFCSASRAATPCQNHHKTQPKTATNEVNKQNEQAKLHQPPLKNNVYTR